MTVWLCDNAHMCLIDVLKIYVPVLYDNTGAATIKFISEEALASLRLFSILVGGSTVLHAVSEWPGTHEKRA